MYSLKKKILSKSSMERTILLNWPCSQHVAWWLCQLECTTGIWEALIHILSKPEFLQASFL